MAIDIINEVAGELGVDPSTIRDARNKKTWRHII